MNNLVAPMAAMAPVAGNRALDGREISKGPNQTITPERQVATPVVGIDYNIFQGSADGATGDSSGSATGAAGSVGAGVGTAAGAAGATASSGEGDSGSPGMAYGGRVMPRRYADGGSVAAKPASAASVAVSPEEEQRRQMQLASMQQGGEGTQTTQPQSGGNPNDYIGQWAHDLSNGSLDALIKGPAMRALEKGDIVSAFSPGAMIIKGLAHGGPVSDNQKMAAHLAAQGRGRDTTLVHMSRPEVMGLGSLHPSGRMPINPKTGLPEADFLTDVLPGIAGTLVGSVVGMPWLGAAIGGLGTWAATGNLGKGILSGLMSFGLGSIGGQLAEAGADAAVKGGTEAAKATAAQSLSEATKDIGTQQLAATAPGMTAAPPGWVDPGTSGVLGQAGSKIQPQGFFDKISQGFQNAPTTLGNIGRGFANPQNLDFSKIITPAGMAAAGGYGLYSANQQPPQMPQPGMPGQGQAPQITTAANPPRLPMSPQQPAGYGTSAYPMEQQFYQPNPAWSGYPALAATGGQMRAYVQPDGTPYELAKGGVAELPSGMIRGPGAGMDDKIKGTIDGRRDVYLSDGEYVVDAQTISALGDGSSEAGAKRMKQLVEEIRQKKFKTKKQPPKMAQLGGIASLG